MYHQAWMLVPNEVRGEGGRELDRFRGKPNPHDRQNAAEAWIGSVTKANGATRDTPGLGCSEVVLPNGIRRLLYEVINDEPEMVLGKSHLKRFGNDLGILVKLLDARAKFLLQCHPSREAAQKYWNSRYGKEECWHVLSARDDAPEPPYILLGFKPGVTRQTFERLYHLGDMGGLEELCHKLIVKPGETYLVPSGMPHALGVGCFVLEIQEPSDITAVPMKQEGLLAYRRRANPKGVFHAIDELDYETRTLESFDYTGLSLETLREKTACEGRVLNRGEWGDETLLIGPEYTSFFSATLMSVSGAAPLPATRAVRIGLVTRGAGKIVSDAGELAVSQGDEVFFPYDMGKTFLTGDFSVILCHPPGVLHAKA